MLNTENQTPLWKAAFSPRIDDQHAEARARLESSLLRMRESVEQLLKMIPSDCKGLTLHDITHLDAVWEMASLIAGGDYEINPAEAYVLGASILLHDAGLTSASYSGGIDELVKTIEWVDIASAELRKAGIELTDELIASPPPVLRPSIIFSVLREIHAQQAEKMATEPWHMPGVGEIFLLDDLELRQSFGESIGRVAHSHHWTVDKVATDLRDHVGVGTSIPSEWAVSERKVACILRCADAAHIDRRRAPTILFAATKPVNVSRIHWASQNKINKPSVDGSTLIYSAGSSFAVDEADAWWLVYDLVKIVDKEIRGSNALLEELGFKRLRITRVLGAENPRALSAQIRTNSWQPIDAEIRVSDPVHLARTLGGRNLYGRDSLAPIREVMQNSADAIRARRALEDREPSWGGITLLIDHDPSDSSACIIHIDDDGIGMTERVLSGPLIDFGKSIWNSDLLRSEFPGLQGKNVKPIGKFGIGFFSIFELADDVKVVSKHYERGIEDARVLEFKSLTSRPHIRAAQPKELPRDTSTRITMRVRDKTRVSGAANRNEDPWHRSDKRALTFSEELISLVPLLDVKVTYHNKIDGTSFEHLAQVYEVSAESFLDEVLVGLSDEQRELVKTSHASRLSLVTDESGNPYGRAALSILSEDRPNQRSVPTGGVSVGGFNYQRGAGLPVPYVGVVEGFTEEAARREAFSRASRESVASWATAQGELINQSDYIKSDLIKACESIVTANGDPKDLPYCFNQGGVVTYNQAKNIIGGLSEVFVLIKPEPGETFAFFGYQSLPAVLLENGLDPSVFLIGHRNSNAFESSAGKVIFNGQRRTIYERDLSYSSSAFKTFLSLVKSTWNILPKMVVQPKQVFNVEYKFQPDTYWTIALTRDQ